MITVYVKNSEDGYNEITVDGNMTSTSEDGVFLILYDISSRDDIVDAEVGRFKWENLIGYSIEED